MIAGAAAGAAKSLESILAEQMFKAKLAEQQQMDAARLQMDQARLNEDLIDRAENRKFRTRQEDRVAAGDREQTNAKEVRRMIGEGITRRVPLGDMQGMAFAEGIDLPKEDKPKKVQYTHTDPRTGVKSLRFASEDQIPEGGLDMGNEPPRPTAGAPANFLTLIDNKGNQRRVPDGPQANQMLEQGWRLFDAVAARSSKPENDREAVDTANEAKRLASALVGHKGFKGVFGLAGSYLPTVRQDTADAEQLLGSLQAMLTMENMGKMKGVLSDSDMKVLRQASTTLSNRMGDASAKAELDRVVEIMSRVAGEGPTAGMPPMDLSTSRDGVNVDDEIARIRATRKPRP